MVSPGAEDERNPTSGFVCARASQGDAVIAPSSVMNWRRFILSPRRRGQAALAARPVGRSEPPPGSATNETNEFSPSHVRPLAWGNRIVSASSRTLEGPSKGTELGTPDPRRQLAAQDLPSLRA